MALPKEVLNAAEGAYFVAEIVEEKGAMRTLVYVRRETDGVEVVGELSENGPARL